MFPRKLGYLETFYVTSLTKIHVADTQLAVNEKICNTTKTNLGKWDS